MGSICGVPSSSFCRDQPRRRGIQPHHLKNSDRRGRHPLRARKTEALSESDADTSALDAVLPILLKSKCGRRECVE
jgi:hypothetical protein